MSTQGTLETQRNDELIWGWTQESITDQNPLSQVLKNSGSVGRRGGSHKIFVRLGNEGQNMCRKSDNI